MLNLTLIPQQHDHFLLSIFELYYSPTWNTDTIGTEHAVFRELGSLHTVSNISGHHTETHQFDRLTRT